MVEEDEGPAAEKRKRELKGDIDYKFIHFNDLPRAFGEGVEGLYTQPIIVLTGGLTSEDKPGALRIDSADSLYVNNVGGGGIRIACGTFTKSATGTTGAVQVIPATNDILYFLYGIVVIGGAHAGAASPLRAGIVGSTGTSDLLQLHLYDATADVDEEFVFPGLGETPAAGAVKMSHPAHSYQTMMAGSGLVTQDGPGAISSAPRYVIEYETMANTETFLYALYFYSVTNSAVTSTASAGAIA